MKKSKISVISLALIALLSSAIIFNSCATKNTNQGQETPSAPEETKKEEEKDPPNVAFAKKLQYELSRNNISGAIELFENPPKGVVLDNELKMLLASLYYSDSQYDKAIAVCNEILAEDPENSDALGLIALCQHASGNSADYKKTADQILKTDPYNTSINIQKAEDYAVNKKYKLARDCYAKAIKGDSTNQDAIFGYGQMSYYLDDLKSAQKSFQQLLDMDENNSSALSYMGKLAGEDENYLRAANYAKKAVELDPNNYDYWLDYGTYLRYLGRYDDACNAWKKAADLDPTYFLAYAYLAGNYDERSMFTEALENYYKVVETNPKYFYAYEEIAILAYHTQNYDDAIKYFNKAYEYSNSYAYKLMVSASYAKKGDKTNAKNVLQPVLKQLERNSLEYDMVRFYFDAYSKNAESSLVQKINHETNSTTRGKMLFYMGLYCELNGIDTMASEYYSKVTAMQAPMFFEYRIAEWSLGL